MTALDRRYDTQIHRRVTRTVMVGDVPMGSEHPIVVQSMINEDTLDIDAAVAGITRLAEAGSEIVRVTTPSMAHARAILMPLWWTSATRGTVQPRWRSS